MGVLLVVAVVGGTIAWRWNQRGPGRPSVDGALGRFRTSPTAAADPRSLVPRSGVYLYEGAGTETLSFLGTRQIQGSTEPGTVVARANGCWTFRIDFNSFHSQMWDRCATKGQLLETGGRTNQKFDFVTFKVDEHSQITCVPPLVVADLTAAPGATTPVHCTGRSQTTEATFTQTGTMTFVGREAVLVGGVRVPGLHVRQVMRLTGGQKGDVRVDTWFGSTDGLPLKEAHTIRVVSPAPAPLGDVTYTERGHWQLTSTTPRT